VLHSRSAQQLETKQRVCSGCDGTASAAAVHYVSTSQVSALLHPFSFAHLPRGKEYYTLKVVSGSQVGASGNNIYRKDDGSWVIIASEYKTR
jgi:hypothetical protein